jgi:hypothetical protein
MKKLLSVFIVLLLAVLMIQTRPDKAQHKEAMMKAIEEYVDEEAKDRLGDNVLAKLGKGVIVKTVETALNSKLKENNYFLFNTTYVRLQGENKVLSLGLFGYVYTFDKEMIREKLEESLPQPEFLRVHRSWIVRMAVVRFIDRLRIVWGDMYIPISDNYKDQVQQYIDCHTLS